MRVQPGESRLDGKGNAKFVWHFRPPHSGDLAQIHRFKVVKLRTQIWRPPG
jgi:hypothetical protein